jgi:hypothetical protein
MKAKRIFPILLAVLFVMSMFPMAALANEPPVETSATFNGNTVIITFDTCPLNIIAIEETGFTVDVDDPSTLDTTVLSAVVTSATTVTLTLQDAIPYDATGVEVEYDGTDLVCEDLEPVDGFTLTATFTAPPPPTFSNATFDGTTMTLTASEALLETANGIPPNGAFAIAVGTPVGTRSVTAVAIAGTTLTLTLDSTIPNDATGVTVTYTAPGASPRLQGLSDNFAATFGPLTATVVAADNSGLTGDDTGGGGALIPIFIDEEEIVVTLPTSLGFEFRLDPQGIDGMSKAAIEALAVHPTEDRLGNWTDPDGPKTAANWEPLPNAGQIVFTDGFAPFAINESNRDMAFEVEAQFVVTDEDDDPLPGVVNALATTGAVNTGTAANVFIGVTFSGTNVNDTPTAGDFAGKVTLPILATAQTPLFIFNQAVYNDRIEHDAGVTTVTRKADMVADTGNGTQFVLTGLCNPQADWGALNIGEDTNLAINLVYTFTELPDAGITPGAAIDGAFGLVAGNSLTATSFVEIEIGGPTEVGFIIGGGVTGTPTAAKINLTKGNDAVVPFNFNGLTLGAGTAAAPGTFAVSGFALMTPFPVELSAIFSHNVSAGTITLDLKAWDESVPGELPEFALWLKIDDVDHQFDLEVTIVP